MGCSNSSITKENKEKPALNIINTPFNSNLILHNVLKIDNIFIKLNSLLKEVETLRVFYVDSLDSLIIDSLNYFYLEISLPKILECILIHVCLSINKELDINILQLREDIFHINTNPWKLNDSFCSNMLDKFFDYFEIAKTLSNQIDIENLHKQIKDYQKFYEIECNLLNKSDKDQILIFQNNLEIIKYGLKLLREIEKLFNNIVDFKIQIKKGIDKVIDLKFVNKIFNEHKNKKSSSNSEENDDLLKMILWENIKESERISCNNYKESLIYLKKQREIKNDKKLMMG